MLTSAAKPSPPVLCFAWDMCIIVSDAKHNTGNDGFAALINMGGDSFTMDGRTETGICAPKTVFINHVLGAVIRKAGQTDGSSVSPRVVLVTDAAPAPFTRFSLQGHAADELRSTVASLNVCVWKAPEVKDKRLLAALKRSASSCSSVLNIGVKNADAIKKILDSHIRAQWDSRWSLSNECRQSKIFMKGPDPEWVDSMKRLSRRNFGLVTQVVTGHGWLNRHRSLLGEVDDPMCRLCRGEVEEPGHLFWRCDALAEERRGYTNRFFDEDGKVRKIIEFLEIDQVRELHDWSQGPQDDAYS